MAPSLFRHWITRYLHTLCSACLIGTLGIAGVSQAQSFPTRSLRFIVPFPPGGATDTLARSLAQKLSESLGQPVVIDNRAGAGGNIGLEAAVRAPADGHTMVMIATATAAIAAADGEDGGLAALLTQRVATLEEENRQLRERAVTAEAAGRAAQDEAASLRTALAGARAALADKEAGLVAALQAATAELTRMGERQAAAERRRALETDNVRQAYRAERDALAGRVSFLEEELKTARAGAEAYRQALRGRGN